MSEVIDRPPVLIPAKSEQQTQPPKKYLIEAWGNNAVCIAKVGLTIQKVFDLPVNVAFQISTEVKRGSRPAVAMGLSHEIAEQKAAQATAYFNELVDNCPCGAKAKFVAAPEA